MRRLLTHVLLPLLVFPFLVSAAVYFIQHQSFVQTGLHLKISSECNPSSPFRLAYTNNLGVDGLLCSLVVLFHTLMSSASRPLSTVGFSVLGVVTLIIYLEAARNRRSLALRMPTAVGILFQLASMGVIMPAYALLFVITGTASIRPSTTPIPDPPSKISQANAEALLFGLLLGYVLPTALMLSVVHPTTTAVWQGFPFLVAFAILAHKVIRPPSRHVQSGHPTVVVTIASTFVVSALLYAASVWPVLNDSVALQTYFVPALDVLDPTATSLADDALEFIKWDVIFGTGSVILATFWMADSVRCLIGIFAWYTIATVAVGPAAAIAGVFLWRERRLNGQMPAEKTPRKTE